MKVGDLVKCGFNDIDTPKLCGIGDSEINQSTVNDMIKNGNFKTIAQYSMENNSCLIKHMRNSEIFSKVLSKKEMQNLGTYFLTIPHEACVELWTAVGDGEIENTRALHQCIISGQRVSSKLIEILTKSIDRSGEIGLVVKEGWTEHSIEILWSDGEKSTVGKELLEVINESR